MADLNAFAEQLVNLSVKEVNELAQILKEQYGIEPAAAAVAVAAGPAAAGAAAFGAGGAASGPVYLQTGYRCDRPDGGTLWRRPAYGGRSRPLRG